MNDERANPSMLCPACKGESHIAVAHAGLDSSGRGVTMVHPQPCRTCNAAGRYPWAPPA